VTPAECVLVGPRTGKTFEDAGRPKERSSIRDRHNHRKNRRPRRPSPVMRARPEVAAGADKPASILVREMGCEADGYGPLVTLGALQAIENTARNLGQEPGVALDKRTAIRVRILLRHVILTWNSLSPGDF
jgi:hypothetical protein